MVVSHSQRIMYYWMPTRKKYFTWWPIPLPCCLLDRKKRIKKKVWQHTPSPPPPPYAAGTKETNETRSTRKARTTKRADGQKSTAYRIHMPRRYAGLGPSRARTRIPSARRLGQLMSLRRLYASMYDNNFPSLVHLSLLLTMSSRVFLSSTRP